MTSKRLVHAASFLPLWRLSYAEGNTPSLTLNDNPRVSGRRLTMDFTQVTAGKGKKAWLLKATGQVEVFQSAGYKCTLMGPVPSYTSTRAGQLRARGSGYSPRQPTVHTSKVTGKTAKGRSTADIQRGTEALLRCPVWVQNLQHAVTSSFGTELWHFKPTSCVPWEKFILATFIPALIISLAISTDREAGPVQHTDKGQTWLRRCHVRASLPACGQRQWKKTDISIFW